MERERGLPDDHAAPARGGEGVELPCGSRARCARRGRSFDPVMQMRLHVAAFPSWPKRHLRSGSPFRDRPVFVKRHLLENFLLEGMFGRFLLVDLNSQTGPLE